MNYWIFTLKNEVIDKEREHIYSIIKTEFEDNYWKIQIKSKNKKVIDVGDRVIFLTSKPFYQFIGIGVIGMEKIYSEYRNNQQVHADYGVTIQDIEIFRYDKSIIYIIDELDFIKNKERWWLHLRSKYISITEKDFYKIIYDDIQITNADCEKREIERIIRDENRAITFQMTIYQSFKGLSICKVKFIEHYGNKYHFRVIDDGNKEQWKRVNKKYTVPLQDLFKLLNKPNIEKKLDEYSKKYRSENWTPHHTEYMIEVVDYNQRINLYWENHCGFFTKLSEGILCDIKDVIEAIVEERYISPYLIKKYL